jgi:hypothetical protein
MGYTRSEQVVAFSALYGGDEPFNNSNEYMVKDSETRRLARHSQ